jgi:hypothetical protein
MEKKGVIVVRDDEHAALAPNLEVKRVNYGLRGRWDRHMGKKGKDAPLAS